MTLTTQSIEKALALTGKKMEDMKRWYIWKYEVEWNFCIAEFCYYLISKDFQEKYIDFLKDGIVKEHSSYVFLFAIQDYQSWNEQPLKDLLNKIP